MGINPCTLVFAKRKNVHNNFLCDDEQHTKISGRGKTRKGLVKESDTHRYITVLNLINQYPKGKYWYTCQKQSNGRRKSLSCYE